MLLKLLIFNYFTAKRGLYNNRISLIPQYICINHNIHISKCVQDYLGVLYFWTNNKSASL